MPGTSRVRALVGAVIAAGALGGCTLHLSDLSFRVDHRLHFTAPKDRALVHEPVTLRWTMRDFTVQARGTAPPTRQAGYFVIFLDQAPVKPRQTLEAVAHGDRTCEVDPRCPDAAYLHQHLVYPTTKTSYTLRLIPNLADIGDDTQLHDVTIVLLDTAGRRIGEAAWHTSFKLKKRVF
jgi:hypothetical protein